MGIETAIISIIVIQILSTLYTWNLLMRIKTQTDRQFEDLRALMQDEYADLRGQLQELPKTPGED